MIDMYINKQVTQIRMES